MISKCFGKKEKVVQSMSNWESQEGRGDQGRPTERMGVRRWGSQPPRVECSGRLNIWNMGQGGSMSGMLSNSKEPRVAGGQGRGRSQRVKGWGRLSQCLVGHCEHSGSCTKTSGEITVEFKAHEWPGLTCSQCISVVAEVRTDNRGGKGEQEEELGGNCLTSGKK